MRPPIIKAINGRKEREQELGSDRYNYFSSGNVVVLNVQRSLLKYMTGKLKKFSVPRKYIADLCRQNAT